jgi:hypothetical protein
MSEFTIDPGMKRIFVLDRNPDSERYLPVIIVRMGAARSIRTGFGNIGAGEATGSDGKVYRRETGFYDTPFTFVIASLSTLERDKILDALQSILLARKKRAIERTGLRLIPNSYSLGGEDTIYIDPTTPIERTSVGLRVYVPWYYDVDISDVPVVERVITPKGYANVEGVFEK